MRHLFTLVLFALFAVPATAQERRPVIGFHVGAVGATLNDEAADPKAGAIAGASLEFPVSRLLGVRMGAQYVGKGAEFSEELFGATISGSIDLRYIELPVLLRIGSGKFFGLAGPVAAFQIGCKAEALGISVDCDEDPDSEIKKFDLGIAVGAGYSFRRSDSFGFTFEFTPTLGLLELDDNGTKNLSVGLTAGVTITR